ncbi:protein MMS22-like [Drosophila eugracilis]|uniref:protein MMS22-like n=1 Tax=Drosophila eugracilis TaxID=29029 RepID=UPI0007E5C318|nr:protein MMS22-like [Drosophila eugracilis]
MDYDLFHSDDDEEILTAFTQATQKMQREAHNGQMDEGDVEEEDTDEGLDFLPEFCCSGRDSLKTQFSSEGFLKNGFAQLDPPHCQLENLCFDFSHGQLSVAAVRNYLYWEACKNVQKLFGAVEGQQQLQTPSASMNSGWFRVRQEVSHIYHLLLTLRESCSELQPEALKFLQDLRQLLNNLLDADAWKVLYFAEHSKGNECQAPAYHLYHGILEWRFLDLHILYTSGDDQGFLGQLERTLDDLIVCASQHYRGRHRPELIHVSPFMCRCTKEMWFLLKNLIPKWLGDRDLDFWILFHKAMQRHKTNYFQGENNGVSLAYHEFYSWLRLGLARLGEFNCEGLYQPDDKLTTPPGSFQTANLLKQFLTCQPDEQQRRVYLTLLSPLQLQLGQPDTDVLCQLWEYFHRSLNCNFSAGSELDQLPLTCPNGAAYVERYSKLLAKSQLEDLNLSSFTVYVWMLGRTLKLLPLQGRSNQRQKLLGRIFSKFSAAKLLALNEPGIHHVIELFLCLLLCHEDLNDLATKLREMLLCLALDKLPPVRRVLVAKGHMAVLLLHAQHRLSMDDYVAKLVNQLATIRNDTEVGAIYVNSMQAIFDLADDFNRGEQQLLGPWLTHYVEKSGQAAQDRVWQALYHLIQRLDEPRAVTGNAGGMKEALQQHILPLLRTQYVSGHSSWLPKLAANFVALEKDGDKLLLGLLQGPEPINMAASAQLMLHVLKDNGRLTSSTILQVWVKSLVLLNAQHESVLALTHHVTHLDEFRQLGIDPASLEDGREPLCAFFGALGRRAQQEEAAAHVRMQLSHKLHAYVNHFELWLPPDRLRSELGSRFYSFLAIVIYNCPTLAYVRSKPSCFFHLAMVRFLLTTQLQAGVPPEGRLPQMVHKIFPVLLQGIGRLPYRSDTYIAKTLEQLVQHWTPHFSFSPNAKLVARPYATLLQADVDGVLAQFVLHLLVSQFLVVHRRKAGQHAGLVITIMHQLIEGTGKEQEHQLLTIVRGVHIPLLEHVMFVDELDLSRSQVFGLYGVLVSHEAFKRSQAVKDICSNDLQTLAEKHLAHCTYFYFQMLIKLAELAPNLVAPLLPFVTSKAKQVEQKRGAGEDVGIRKCLQRLQKVLS